MRALSTSLRYLLRRPWLLAGLAIPFLLAVPASVQADYSSLCNYNYSEPGPVGIGPLGPGTMLQSVPTTAAVGQDFTARAAQFGDSLYRWYVDGGTVISIENFGPLGPNQSAPAYPSGWSAVIRPTGPGTLKVTVEISTNISQGGKVGDDYDSMYFSGPNCFAEAGWITVAAPAPTGWINAPYANPCQITVNQPTCQSYLFWGTANAASVLVQIVASGANAYSYVDSAGSWVPVSVPQAGLVAYLYGNGTLLGSVAISALPPAPPPTISLTPAPATISAGQSSSLSWQTQNATSVTIDQGLGEGQPTASGDVTVTPATTTTYTATATGPGGTAIATATVTVNLPPAPVVTLSIDGTSEKTTTVSLGGSATLRWTIQNPVESCQAQANPVTTAWTGSQPVPAGAAPLENLQVSTRYTLACSGPGGQGEDSVEILVTNSQSTTTMIEFDAMLQQNPPPGFRYIIQPDFKEGA